MELISAIIAFDWIKLAMTIMGFIVVFGIFDGIFSGGAGENFGNDDDDEDDDDDDDYENASWNPGSVNYNG